MWNIYTIKEVTSPLQCVLCLFLVEQKYFQVPSPQMPAYATDSESESHLART